MGLLDRFRVSKKTNIVPKDIVVFLAGPSGAGKSWLLSILLQVAKSHVPIGRGPRLDVAEIHAERCRFEGEQSDVVLVDTPSLSPLWGFAGEEDLKGWLNLKYRKPCKAAGILYLHNIGSNPYDEFLKVSRNLSRLMPLYHQGLAPGIVHVIPTITPGAKIFTGRIDASILLLKRQADEVGASMLRTPFDGSPETAWGIVQELLNGMKLGGSFTGCASEEIPFHWRGTALFALDRNIALSRTLLEDTPLGHPDQYLALVDLADLLYRRLMREESREDLDEIITLRRAAFELTSSGHQERLEALTNLADCLDRRFWHESAAEDLVEAIPIRRAALELTPPGHQEHRTSLVRLATCLEQRFSIEGALEDLTEAITLRRAALKLTPTEHEDYFVSLARLADCLGLQYFKSGGTLSDLEEIISLQQAALALNVSSTFDKAMCRAGLTRCLYEKHLRQHVTPPVVDFAPPVYNTPSICDPIFPHPTFLLLASRNRSEILSRGPACASL